ncbi:MAG: response regulator, partial [Rhizobacter sp.]|nr:response regulator [Rhizobacter sp.]
TTAADAGGTLSVPASLAGRRVLLVEDNDFNQLVAAELLRDVAHMEVTVAPNGQVAVDLLRGGSAFDMVLMDVQMPVMDGLQATRLIRQEPAHAQLPIVAMTAHAMLRDREKCLDAGMNDYVTKPFDPHRLFAVMARWLPAKAPAGRPEGDAISFELGLKGCLGRTELYDRILRRFVEARADDAAQVQACLASNDGEQIAAIAHTMVSNAGTIGALALSDAARQLQQAVDADERALWPELAQAFSDQHARAMAALRAHFDSQPPTPT